MSDNAANGRDPNCMFCKIIDRQIPAKVVIENDHAFAIRDVNPQAPTHILILPKNHIANIGEVKDEQLLGRLFLTATEVAVSEGLDNGYRIVVNTGNHGGQTVFHLHLHLMGGRALGWPPG
jgi:histidine triad (HIT) family protein